MATPAAVNGLMTIGAVAERTGMANSALRFYEREGLVTPVARTAAGYRLYDEEQVARVRFIHQAQHLGLSLPEVHELLTAADCDDPVPTRDRLRHLVARKLVTARQQIDDLKEFADQLERVHRRLAGDPGCGCRHLGSCGGLSTPLTNTDESAGELKLVKLAPPVSGR